MTTRTNNCKENSNGKTAADSLRFATERQDKRTGNVKSGSFGYGGKNAASAQDDTLVFGEWVKDKQRQQQRQRRNAGVPPLRSSR
jgi:hypothetical protein